MADNPETLTERPIELPMDDWHLGLEEAASKLPGRVKQCARNAFLHLRKAWQLHGIDDEMSAFRAITGEEEAATALIAALRQQGYTGADRLNPRNHVHKSTLWPLMATIGRFLARAKTPTPKVALSKDGPPKVRLWFDINQLTGAEGEPLWAEPDQPLNFAIRYGKASSEIIHLFREELAELASEAGENSISTYVKKEANLRNKLLYASDASIPKVVFQDDMLLERLRRVSVLVTIAIVVMQTKKRQLFVVQCLETLLTAIDAVKDVKFDYSPTEDQSKLPKIAIFRQEGAPAQVTITRSIQVSARWGYPSW